MAKEHRSPEERLLALIRGKPKKPQPQAPEAAVPEQPKVEKAKAHYPGALFNPSVFRHRHFEPAMLKVLNRYLVVVTILLGLYFLIDIFFVKPREDIPGQVEEKPIPVGTKVPESANGGTSAARDYSFYSSEISNKNIFGQGQEGSPEQIMAAPEDVAASLGLVGVVAGDNPQAIIEDKKAQKTYYLTKGQSFNGMTVEEISEGKVVLDYQGKKIALLL